jgi:catalase-peroxidase
MSKCPFMAMQEKITTKPQRMNLGALNQPKYLDNFDYSKAFLSLDLDAIKKDIVDMLRTSQDWWPADYGHYGPFMVRFAWHQAGTYRAADGRGGANTGNMRFYPHNSWPDNGNLDKARRLVWPIKQKYGKKISWADLIMLVGNVAMEDMGFETFGFGGGRQDIWASETDAYWGEDASFTGLLEDPSKLEQPLGAAVMRLIYVNPEGPDGVPDPLLAAAHIRETFGRMSMNDEETVALVAGGHTFGKCHGAAPGSNHGPEPELANIEEQGFGWTSKHGTGKGGDTITSGLEGAWTVNPAKWDHGYFENLFKYEWEVHKGPGGANQWRPKNGAGVDEVPDAHDPTKKHQPMMLTTDLSMIKDPAYLEISKKFKEEPETFRLAFAKAWYKLTHRDMGPARRLLGPKVPPPQIWQDPVPQGKELSTNQVAVLKGLIQGSGLTTQQMVCTAWASASTYRQTDFRGGSNGARIRFAPQKDWEVNNPAELSVVLAKYGEIKAAFSDDVSLADLIVLGGNVGVEMAATAAGYTTEVPFVSGRGDATEEQTDAASFAVLEPTSDAFRNFKANPYKLVDRAHMLALTAPEMAVLIAGMRVLDTNAKGVGSLGVLTTNPGTLTNDFFVNLLDMSTEWKPSEEMYKGCDRSSGALKWMASAVDLSFGSNSELRAIAEYYAMSDSKEVFVEDFGKAWAKVMSNGV